MRRVLCLLLVCLISLSLFASKFGNSPLDATRLSAFSSVSYFDRISDVYANPAALPFVSSGNQYQFVYAASENYDTSIFGKEAVPYLQNQNQEFLATITSGVLGVSAKGSTQFTDRLVQPGEAAPNFDIYSSVDLEIDVAYSIADVFSIGLLLGGGNSLVRLNKNVTGIISSLENAWFSPYESLDNTGNYYFGYGLQAHFYGFSLGYCARDVIFEGSPEDSLASLVQGELGLSYCAEKYSPYGDLKLFVPRGSIALKGFFLEGKERTLSIKADILMQFMKRMSLDAGVGYIYEVVEGKNPASYISLSFRGSYFDYSLGFELSHDLLKSASLIPSIYFTYAK